ncbi:MAG: response regulator transcription factor [Cytophagaceae bacterium]|nr:MAG: response regulator transcription factor [Cytophagaceae bacterium]
MKIAIVDFDLTQAKSVCEILANAGHECTPFQENAELLQRFQHEPYDALVVDLQHAEEEQTNPIQTIRKRVPATVPILCIAGSTNEEEIVASLDAGANDYLFRPIRPRELVTRILVLLRQAYPYQVSDEQLQFGSYVFEPRRGRVTVMGKSVNVTRKEFDLSLIFPYLEIESVLDSLGSGSDRFCPFTDQSCDFTKKGEVGGCYTVQGFSGVWTRSDQ